MTLELLFDIPEEVVLRKEKWGAQSQELPALAGREQIKQGEGWLYSTTSPELSISPFLG